MEKEEKYQKYLKKKKEEHFSSNQSSAIKKIKLHRNEIISEITSIDTFANLLIFLDNNNIKFYCDKTFKKNKDVKIPLEFNYTATIKPLREKLVITYLHSGSERKEVVEKEKRKVAKIRKINDNNYSFDFNGGNYRLSYEDSYWRLYRKNKEICIGDNKGRKTLCSVLEHLKIKYNAIR